MNLIRLTWVLIFSAAGWAQCVSFPTNLVPLASVNYVTAADPYGDHLIVGSLAGGLNALTQIPLPPSTNQLFCGSQVPLAPQQFYAGVYVPTAAERSGNFPDFVNLLVDPTTNQPYPGGVIPSNLLGQVYAFRVAAAQPPQGITPWVATGSMGIQLGSQAAVLLPGGKVLVVPGGASCNGLGGLCLNPYAQLYDPMTGTFTATGTPLSDCGPNPTATLLNNGQVLVVGGDYSPATAQLYDPSTGKFTYTGPPLLAHGDNHTSTLLNDGRVLITGGHAGVGVPSLTPAYTNAGAEIYDPSSGFFTMAGPMNQTRAEHTATLLADGRVLITGGDITASAGNNYTIANSAEIFNPSTGNFSPTGSMATTRSGHYAVLLPDGQVLVGGGADNYYPPPAELFNPSSGTFALTGTMVEGYRGFAAATLLSSGQVLVAGGFVIVPDALVPGSSTELYTPSSGIFTPAGSMTASRAYFTATLLSDGRVLATGGQSSTGEYSSAEVYTPLALGLVTSQTGLTFQSAPGGSPAAQTVEVLSPSSTIPWTLSVKAFSGGNWLTATPSSGASAPGSPPVPVAIKVNTAGLASQSFYGSVTLTPTDGVHPPVSITVVLNIVPVGTAVPLQVSPGGLLFSAEFGSSPPPRTFAISNISSNAISFTATAASTPSWFTINPKSGTVTSSQPAAITVTPTSAALPIGVFTGTVTLAFSDSSKQIVTLALVVTPPVPGANVPAGSHATASNCTASRLVPVLTSVSSGYTAEAGWPVPLIAQVQDNCGNSLTTGSVTASFTNGDAPLALVTVGGGTWSATWVPGRTYPGSTVRVDAQNPQTSLSGSAQVAVQIGSNPNVPEVSAGGIVSSADFASSPAVGLLVSIFGSGLADSAQSNASLPLPPQLGSTSAFLSSGEQLPLLYVSDSVMNVLIPYDAVTQTAQQVVVQHGNALSVPMPIAIFNQSPSILSADGSGSGQGHIYVIGAGGVETQANAITPAHTGEPLVIYCVGLGPVTPLVSGGTAAPYSPLAAANAAVAVTFGGQIATPVFAGLTPGLAGLYQINVTLPTGITPGNQVPVTISAGAAISTSAIFMAIQ